MQHVVPLRYKSHRLKGTSLFGDNPAKIIIINFFTENEMQKLPLTIRLWLIAIAISVTIIAIWLFFHIVQPWPPNPTPLTRRKNWDRPAENTTRVCQMSTMFPQVSTNENVSESFESCDNLLTIQHVVVLNCNTDWSWQEKMTHRSCQWLALSQHWVACLGPALFVKCSLRAMPGMTVCSQHGRDKTTLPWCLCFTSGMCQRFSIASLNRFAC